jgi:hypothetical protein
MYDERSGGTVPVKDRRERMNKELAEYILSVKGYNWALSEVEEACEFLDHPVLKPEDRFNYHKWAEPYPRRCYCSAIGYTEAGRFYACDCSKEAEEIYKKIFPDFKNRFGEPYLGREL